MSGRSRPRLRQIDWFSGDVTDFYGDLTEAAVAGSQAMRGLPVTGVRDVLRRVAGGARFPYFAANGTPARPTAV